MENFGQDLHGSTIMNTHQNQVNIPDQFQNDTMMVARAIIYGEWPDFNCENRAIVDAINSLVQRFLQENVSLMQNMANSVKKELIQTKGRYSTALWLSLHFEETIKKFGDTPTWDPIFKIIIYVEVVRQVAGKKYTRNLKNKLEHCFQGYIRDKFGYFIVDCGGWQDMITYCKFVESRMQAQKDTDLIISTAKFFGVVILVLLMFRF